jgi:hypothetical protein
MWVLINETRNETSSGFSIYITSPRMVSDKRMQQQTAFNVRSDSNPIQSASQQSFTKG